MNEDFIRDRISILRTKKGVSEYKMSLDLGHSKSYMQSISSGRSLPPLSEFLYICEYLGVSPQAFFDTQQNEPALIQELLSVCKAMSEQDLRALLDIAKRLSDKN